MLEEEVKGNVTEKSVEDGDRVYGTRVANRYNYDVHDLDRVQRRLKQRHVQIGKIAGTIGTEALAAAGPLGALLAYMLVGTVAYSASTPVEISAAVILLGFWDVNAKHVPVYTIILCVAICSFNLLGVKTFGEAEFCFSLIKIALILALLLAGLIIDLGGGPNHQRTGFRYWKNPSAFNRAGLVGNNNTDRFLAFLSVLIQASFSYGGVELVAMRVAASETENPRRNISKAVQRVFFRIALFYILGILMIGMLVSYDNPDLLRRTGTAAQSPFVIAFNTAGVKVFPHIINACVFTSAFSAGNSSLFTSSRILYGLALRGQAPRIFAYCTKHGLPIAAMLTSSCFAFLSFMSVKSGSETVFNWFVNLGTIGVQLGWFSINVTYICWRRGMLAQGFDLKKNVYNNRLQPYIAYWGAVWNALFILINGFEVFFKWNVSDFLTAYINIPIFVALFLFWKIWKSTVFWKPEEIDLVTGIPSIEETESPEEPPRNVWEKIANFLF
ncbi:general amino acid permease 1 [Amanita rubescens]|nr:general amino acid permease 1 [Amanita rubescens]